MRKGIFLVLACTLLTWQCKPRQLGSYSMSGVQRCSVPEPTPLFFAPLVDDSPKLELAGYFGIDSLGKARKFLRSLPNKPVDLNSGKTIIAEAYGSTPGADRNKKEWLIIYYEKNLYLYNQQAPKDFDNFYIIENIEVRKMMVSSTSAHLMLVTGDYNELFSIRLSGLANLNREEKTAARVGNDAVFKVVRRFLNMRKRYLHMQPRKDFRETFFISGLFSAYAADFRENTDFTNMDNIGFTYNRMNYDEGRLFTWNKLNHPEAFKSEQSVITVGENVIYPSNDGFLNDDRNEQFRKDSGISKELNIIINKDKFSAQKDITAVAVAPYTDAVSGREAPVDALRASKTPLEEIYAARIDCNDDSAAGKGECIRLIVRIASYNTANENNEAGYEIVYGDRIPKAENISSRRITHLAVSQGREKKIAFVDQNGIFLLTKDVRPHYRIKKKFLSRAKIRQIDFVRTTPNDFYNGDQLLVQFKEEDGSLNREIIKVDLVLGGIPIGKLPAGPMNTEKDARFINLSRHGHIYAQASPEARKNFWQTIPGRDNQAVYGVAFTNDCQGLITGDATGGIAYWDLNKLPSLGARPNMVLNSVAMDDEQRHDSPIKNLKLSSDGKLLLSREKDRVIVWRVEGRGLYHIRTIQIESFNFEDALNAAMDASNAPTNKPAEPNSPPTANVVNKNAQEPDKAKPETKKKTYQEITAASFTPNNDAVIVATSNDLPQIFSLIKNEEAANSAPPPLPPEAPQPPAPMDPNSTAAAPMDPASAAADNAGNNTNPPADPPTPPAATGFQPTSNYKGIDKRYSQFFVGQGRPITITAIAPFPGKESEFVEAILGDYPDSADAQNITESVAFATDMGGLYTSNIKNGGRFKREKPDLGAMYWNLTITDRGQWLFAAGSDLLNGSNGLMERFFNQAIDYDSVGVTDVRCLGPVEVARRYAQQLKEKNSFSAKIALAYRGHAGPIYNMEPVVFRHSAKADIERIDGIITTGVDGTLVTWQMLESCDDILRGDPIPTPAPTVDPKAKTDPKGAESKPKPEPKPYDKKILNVAYSDHVLTSLAVSPDYEYAATGTVDGTILLWWIGSELEID